MLLLNLVCLYIWIGWKVRFEKWLGSWYRCSTLVAQELLSWASFNSFTGCVVPVFTPSEEKATRHSYKYLALLQVFGTLTRAPTSSPCKSAKYSDCPDSWHSLNNGLTSILHLAIWLRVVRWRCGVVKSPGLCKHGKFLWGILWPIVWYYNILDPISWEHDFQGLTHSHCCNFYEALKLL